MTKKKILTYGSILALTLFLGFGVSSADAFFGGKNITSEERATMTQNMFEEQAKLLGVSVDEIKTAWAQGQNMWELAKAKGISEDTIKAKMQTLRKERMTEELKVLVSKGIITQAQADLRIKSMETMSQNMNGKKLGGRGEKGRGMGWMPGMFNF